MLTSSNTDKCYGYITMLSATNTPIDKITMATKSMKFGSGDQCHIRIRSMSVSRFHAVLAIDTIGNAWVTDCSKNGIHELRKERQLTGLELRPSLGCLNMRI
jgi:FHA domain